MQTILTYDDLLENVDTLRSYSSSPHAEDREYARQLIRQGVCFVVHVAGGEPFFAPSRFVGYKANTRAAHATSPTKDGRITNEVINIIAGSKPNHSEALELEYQQFCTRLGIKPRDKAPFGASRRFWILSKASNFETEVVRSLNDNPAERKKRLRKAPKKPRSLAVIVNVFARNPDVVAEVLLRAKGICEGCKKEAPFRRRSDNTPYLEVHHKVRLADGGDDTVENALALCPNCHRKSHYA
ncbi:HNH endonuclease [Noviherbaspirillum sp. DKR-6]|uniref:HNH endonuclease n=2 Tax=Noviherbaspirillum pedocola TaxID=2801341 RepID=A0A934SVI6_9BURK|nr:HNH endonuclease [Noviherbaspirillum pedocola]